MPQTLEQLKYQLGQLSDNDRAELAEFLLQSLEPSESEEEIEAAWAAELDRRGKEIENGTVVGEPVEKVMADLRAKYM